MMIEILIMIQGLEDKSKDQSQGLVLNPGS
jgi:hypothetical protein